MARSNFAAWACSWRTACVALLLGAGVVASAQAGVLATRAELRTVLGGPGTLADFEASMVPAGTAYGFPCDTGSVITSASVCGPVGSGLVPAGLGIRSPFNRGFQFNAVGVFSAPSDEVLVNDGKAIELDFSATVSAFGVDLRTFDCCNLVASVSIYAADDTTLLDTISGIDLQNGVPEFFGYESAGGIGRVFIQTTNQFRWSPSIDNVEFGVAVPLPGTAALALLALMALLAQGARPHRRGH